MRVGVVGYGLAGRVFHAPLITATPGLEVAAIVTADADRAARAAGDHPGAAVVADVDALLDGPRRVDALVVATPNATHVPLATRAVDAGVPVVVDKPLAAGPDEGRALVARARRAGVALTVFHQRRWDGDVRTVRALLDAGRLGRVHRFESRFERWRPEPRVGAWREDDDPAAAGGLLADLGSHLIDQARWLWGPVRSVYSELDRRRPGAAVDDDVFVALEHVGGVRSHLWTGALVGDPGPSIRVLGDRGTYSRYGRDVQETQLGAGLRPGDPGWAVDDPAHDGHLRAGDADEVVPTVAGAWQDFYAGVAAMLAGGPPPVDPADAVAVLEVIEAARRSASAGQVVALS